MGKAFAKFKHCSIAFLAFFGKERKFHKNQRLVFLFFIACIIWLDFCLFLLLNKKAYVAQVFITLDTPTIAYGPS